MSAVSRAERSVVEKAVRLADSRVVVTVGLKAALMAVLMVAQMVAYLAD